MLGLEAAAVSPHLEQTLEDEFLELQPSQVRAALRQAGGCLQTARTLCSRLAAQQLARAAGPAAPLPVALSPARAPQQRQWWPRNEFCASSVVASTSSAPARSPGNSASTQNSYQRPALVPHQVLPLPAQPRTQQPQQPQPQVMQPPGAASGQRAAPATSSSRQPPSAGAIRRLLGIPAAGPGSVAGSSGRQVGNASASGIADGGVSSNDRTSAPASSTAAGASAAVARAQQASPQQQQQQQQAEPPLHPHYAAVFLTDKSRQQLLQHVPPLHEEISADHMTMAYKPTPAQCLQLPLGRDAALFVVGAAADYRAQAVAVQHPSWVPFISESTPHVTVSVADGVPAREAGDLTAAALAAGQAPPVARLKLLQGTVGVQLSDGSRVFSAEDLQAALAAAAARQRAAAARAAPVGLLRILPRGAAPPAAPPAPPAPESGPAEPATEPAVPSVPAAPAQAAPPSGGSAPGGVRPPSKVAAWDLDALLDQLHMAEQPPARAAAPEPPAAAAQQAQQAAPRRGLLKLPAALAAEVSGPSSSPAAPVSSAMAAGRTQRRPPPPPQQQQQQRHHQAAAGTSSGIEWAQPEAPVAVRGKSVAEEAAEAAAGDEPLDLVSSLAQLLPGSSLQGPAAASPVAHPQPPLPSPTVLPGLGVTATASSGAEAGASGYETSSSSGSATLGEEGGGGWGGGAAPPPLDPETQRLLQLQFPELHHLVIDTALRMHGGSLPAATQFLAVLDQQQQQLGLAGLAGGEGRAPQHPTLGSFLQGVLPEAAEPAALAYDFPPSTGGYADSAGDWAGGGRGRAQAAPLAQQRRGSAGAGPSPGRGWQQHACGGRGRGKAARRGTAGDDPMSVTERQAMNLHLSAKRLYTQAAQEAFASGQLGLGKELQATARSHSEAASAARRRANASAFRSTNASVTNTFTLDLHGQHVGEALASLERYLVTLGGLGHPGGVLLQVITGVGRHSHGNQPRILPAVVRYLSDAGYKFDSDETNPGVINVSIGV